MTILLAFIFLALLIAVAELAVIASDLSELRSKLTGPQIQPEQVENAYLTGVKEGRETERREAEQKAKLARNVTQLRPRDPKGKGKR